MSTETTDWRSVFTNAALLLVGVLLGAVPFAGILWWLKAHGLECSL